MKSVLDFTFEEFDQWAADAGCTCKTRAPLASNRQHPTSPDRPGRAIINLAAKTLRLREAPTGPAYPRRRAWRQPSDRAQPVVSRSGQWIAERILIPDFAYVPPREPRARLVAVDRRLSVEPPQQQ